MKSIRVLSLVAVAALVLVSCETAPSNETDRAALHARVNAAIESFKKQDPGMARFFSDSHGYAVFPSVGKGAIGVGGAYGRGEVFEGGTMIGYCDLSQGTIGLQLGGQEYQEVIFFQNKSALDSFKNGEFELSAQASAVAADAGASTTADYQNGVLVFTMAKGGLMYEASVGGQKFDYVPR